MNGQTETASMGADGGVRQAADAIAQAVRGQIDKGAIPGALVHISQAGATSYLEAFGHMDLESGTPTAPDTIFRFYSMSKPITGAAVMTLVDEGRIGLDDPIKAYLPEFADMTVRRQDGGLEPSKRDISIRHLMTHTSGLSYLMMPSPVQEDYRAANVFAIRNRLSESLEAHVKRLARLPLAAQPGAAWNYGESMGVLGRLIEVVSGQSYGSYLRARLFDPLEMVDTDFWAPPEKAHRLSQLYISGSSFEGLANARDADHYGGSYLVRPRLEYGGAGLVGTSRDFMNFAFMLLAGGVFRGQRVISRASVAMMLTDQLRGSLGDQPLASLGRPPGVSSGLCGSVVVFRDAASPPGTVGQYGWNGWASTSFWIDPRNDLAGLILTQVIPEAQGTVELGLAVRAAIYASAARRSVRPASEI